MKLRYYMRGLGIGMLVTAILMSVTIHGKTEKLTDAQIKERAAELGMEEKYDSTVLSESQKKDETSEKKDAKEDTVKKDDSKVEEKKEEVRPEETKVEEKVEEVKPEETKAEEIKTDETKIDQKTDDLSVIETDVPKVETKKDAEITVKGGEGSGTVAKKLAEAGLVKDAKEFDDFLCKNGYDKRICTGKHVIKNGATYDEIAQNITSKGE